MPKPQKNQEFISINIAVLTVSDTRTEETDTSGKALAESLTGAGHHLAEKIISTDDIYQIRAVVSRWIAAPAVDVVLITGGTGMTWRDVTPEAILPLLDKEITGFGEMFRNVSYQEVQTSALQSRALAGMANGTFIFCIPGSTNACHTAWNHILKYQLDSRHGPCNFVELMPRLKKG